MKTDRPNVLVVFTDQQRWDTCSCYGNQMGLTPNLDALAQRGALFERAFTCQPVCGPARASLQTGMYAVATSVTVNSRPLPANLETLATCFGQARYDTGYIGKWHLAGTHGEPVPQQLRGGYRYWLAADTLETTSHPYDGVIFDGDGQPVQIDDYRVDWLTDRAIEFIDSDRGDKPFFLFLSYLEPHHQNDWNRFVGPRGYAEKYADCYIPPDLAGHDGDWQENLPDYYGTVARIDECLGRLMSTLQTRGLADDTIVLFTSDHGCHFRTRNREYKRSCHESSIRIPMVLAGGPLGPKRIDKLVSLVDLPPTLLDACGLAIPKQMQGRSMLPLLEGQAEDWPDDVFVQISESHVARAVRTERWKYCAAAPGRDPDNDARSDVYVDHCLYDLKTDPYEQHNLVDDPAYRDVLDQMRTRLKRRMAAAGEAEPAIQAPTSTEGPN